MRVPRCRATSRASCKSLRVPRATARPSSPLLLRGSTVSSLSCASPHRSTAARPSRNSPSYARTSTSRPGTPGGSSRQRFARGASSTSASSPRSRAQLDVPPSAAMASGLMRPNCRIAGQYSQLSATSCSQQIHLAKMAHLHQIEQAFPLDTAE